MEEFDKNGKLETKSGKQRLLDTQQFELKIIPEVSAFLNYINKLPNVYIDCRN